jgi:choline-sulfatase
MISYVDEKVGKLLRSLEKTGLDKNTIIIFTGDHGEMMGERGMWFKQTFYEWSSRVPLVISTPEMRANKRHIDVSNVVSLVDLFPTILEFAQEDLASVANSLDGHSLVPLMNNNSHEWSNLAISEYTDMGVCAPCRMVRLDNFKYIYTHGHPAQLYDLDVDSLELNNLSGNASFRGIEENLKSLTLKDWDPVMLEKEILRSQAERKIVNDAAKKSRKYPNWSFEADRKDTHRYVRGSGDQEGTVAVKGRARYPYVDPSKPDNESQII